MNLLNINIINEMDLTNWVNAIISVPRSAEISSASFKNKDYVIKNKNMIAIMVLNSYIRSHIHQQISRYVTDTDFLSPVTDKTNLSEPILTSIAAGHSVYRINIEKIPIQLEVGLKETKEYLIQKIIMHIDQSVAVAQPGQYVVDLKTIRNSLPDLETVLKRSYFAHGHIDKKNDLILGGIPQIIQISDRQKD